MTDPQAAGRPVKVAILGFGTVGSSLARIVCERTPQDVELCCVFNRGVARKRVPWAPSSVLWTERFEDVLAAGPDIVVEVAGGLEPAGEWIRASLAAGKSVVTANKKLIAAHGPALEALARLHGCQLLYGAAVAGGVPVIPGVQQGLAGDRINTLRGILNGTCNFILSNMESGLGFDEALVQAQAMGYAEADPTEDVDGFDARAKLVILSRVGLRMEVQPEEIACRTIRDLAAIGVAYAADLHCPSWEMPPNTLSILSRSRCNCKPRPACRITCADSPSPAPLFVRSQGEPWPRSLICRSLIRIPHDLR